MRFVNTVELPAPLFAAIEHDDHVSLGSDIGVTTLTTPAKQSALLRLHRDDIVEEAADHIYRLFGQAVHVVLERAARGDGIETFAEERWELERLGWRIAGRLDYLTLEPTRQRRRLTDYKVTSVWSVKDDEPKDEWSAQLNLLALFGFLNRGLEVDELRVTALLRDWRKNEKLRFGDSYPSHPVATVAVKKWPFDVTEAYLAERVAAHQQARLLVDAGRLSELEPCTPDERWEQPTIYAVRKRGNIMAMKGGAKHTTMASAEAFIRQELPKQKPGVKLEVDVRPGRSPRCEQYCGALPFCAQGQALVAASLELSKKVEQQAQGTLAL